MFLDEECFIIKNLILLFTLEMDGLVVNKEYKISVALVRDQQQRVFKDMRHSKHNWFTRQ